LDENVSCDAACYLVALVFDEYISPIIQQKLHYLHILLQNRYLQRRILHLPSQLINIKQRQISLILLALIILKYELQCSQLIVLADHVNGGPEVIIHALWICAGL
jgi:hypothetical protein